MVNNMEKLRNTINTILGWACVFVFAVMVVVGTYQIVVRYFFNNPSTVSEELLTYSFTWMYGGISIMKLTMTQITASLGVSMGLIYTIIPLSGILIVIYGIMNIIDLAKGKGE